MSPIGTAYNTLKWATSDITNRLKVPRLDSSEFRCLMRPKCHANSCFANARILPRPLIRCRPSFGSLHHRTRTDHDSPMGFEFVPILGASPSDGRLRLALDYSHASASDQAEGPTAMRPDTSTRSNRRLDSAAVFLGALPDGASPVWYFVGTRCSMRPKRLGIGVIDRLVPFRRNAGSNLGVIKKLGSCQ